MLFSLILNVRVVLLAQINIILVKKNQYKVLINVV